MRNRVRKDAMADTRATKPVKKAPAKKAAATAVKPSILVSTELAALYLLMQRSPNEHIQLFRQAEIQRAKNTIYNMARDGELTRHGGSGWGEARWDLPELHRALHSES